MNYTRRLQPAAPSKRRVNATIGSSAARNSSHVAGMVVARFAQPTRRTRMSITEASVLLTTVSEPTTPRWRASLTRVLIQQRRVFTILGNAVLAGASYLGAIWLRFGGTVPRDFDN